MPYTTTCGRRNLRCRTGKGLQSSVETDESGTTRNEGREKSGTGNVVPFPRDWFGPREELIPFGPSATDPAPPEPHQVVDAHTFWGEDPRLADSSLYEPLGHDPSNWPSTRPGHTYRRRPTLRVPRPRRISFAVPPIRRPVLGSLSRRGADRRTRAILLSGVALALLLAVVLIDLPGQRPAHPSVAERTLRPAVASAHAHHTVTNPAVADVHSSVRGASSRKVVHRQPRALRRHITRRHSAQEQPVTTPVHYSPGATSSGASPATNSASQSPNHITTPTIQPASSQSQPPAFGSAGALGPGTSPNS